MTQRLPILTGFESTFMPEFDVDIAETSGHISRRRDDLLAAVRCGVRTIRYPVRWHRVGARPGRFDWSDTDEVFAMLHEVGLEPIVDLVHHTSYPKRLARGFCDAAFPDEYLRYVEAFVTRYPTTAAYTLFNETFSTLFLCGHEGVWPPYGRGMEDYIAILSNVLPAICAAGEIAREGLPYAEHVWVDSCEHHTGSDAMGIPYAAYANDRRFFVLDALTGNAGDTSRPFVADVLAHGGDRLLELPGVQIDVLGLDYYSHCQWHFTADGGVTPTPTPLPLATLIGDYARRYGVPCMLTETNIRGTGSDRATWFKYVLEQCERALEAGVDIQGVCWFPFVDSCDWTSLLRAHAGSVDPVGVISIDPSDGSRFPVSLTTSLRRAAQGETSAALPAYELQQPVATWLRGYAEQMAHWHWQTPPPHEMSPASVADPDYRALGALSVEVGGQRQRTSA